VAVVSEIQSAVVNTAASGNTTIVGAQGAGVKIRVVGFFLVAAGAVVVNLQSGAGGTSLTGPMSAITGVQLSAGPSNGLFDTAPNALLNLNLGAAVQVSGFVNWVTVS
jgi:hypothetical protein